ncbi:hypothetical protein K457DRAFT_150817 [Linnemannia elongata AG-77]|uniref:Uncharacterized protein n=1 Tax=Linnemannia elongata AG-77 TaxID=1314771 RepID=A0A197KHK7_9FUNG|nr:hypothetical protein K457DRAFT_150817 [Linnemannia elongata AG-77]
MSLKATAKEFIPSFNISKQPPPPPHLLPQTGGAAPIPDTVPTPSSSSSSSSLLNQPSDTLKTRLNGDIKDSSVHNNKPRPQQKQQNRGPPRQENVQQLNQHQHHQNGGERGHQKSDQTSHQKRDPQQRNNGPHSNKSRHPHPQQQQPQQVLSTTGSGQQSGNHGGNSDLHNPTLNSNSRRNKNANAQTGRSLNKEQIRSSSSSSNTSTTTSAAQGSSSAHGSGKHQHQLQQRDNNSAATAAASGAKPPLQGRSGSFSKTSAQGSHTSSTNAKTRKGSIDHAGSGSINSNSAANGSANAGGSSNAGTASANDIIPGMEATAFICLTDVILPVRHVVKDGVSTMKQGSDAYLDWIVRSLKEHEEITLIGMEAAIPDIIALVLRAGIQGIGYQEIRTFTTQDGFGGNKSCLQFRMHRGQGYIPLEKRPPRS